MSDPGKYIGLGANLGDPAAAIRKALAEIDKRGLGRVAKASSLYRTEPVGIKDQPWFVNAAAEIETGLDVQDFHQGLKSIERDFGRPGQRVQDGPRPIDLDILLWGPLVIRTETLIVPHPRFHLRRFVLEPLAEIAPDAVHPEQRISVSAFLSGLLDPARVEKLPRTKR